MATTSIIKKYGCRWVSIMILMLAFVSWLSGLAQETETETFYFENRVGQILDSFHDIAARPHFLGEVAGKKYAVFHDLYSYIVPGNAVYAGPQMVIDKPIIYRSVQQINKYYQRMLRQKKISEPDAFEKVNHLMDVAISVYTQPTEALEEKLRKSKKAEHKAMIFEKIKLQ